MAKFEKDHLDSHLKQSRSFFKDPLLLNIFIGVLVMAAIYSGLYLYEGHGLVLVQIPSYALIMYIFVALTSICISFLAGGRYGVLRDPFSFWTCIAFLIWAVGIIFSFLTFPGVAPAGKSILKTLPNTDSFMVYFSTSFFSIALLVADLAQGPGKQGFTARWWKWEIGSFLILTIVIYTLAIYMEKKLPSLISDQGVYTILNLYWMAIALVLFAGGAALSIRRYKTSGDHLVASIGILQITTTFGLIAVLLGRQRFDSWWYLSRTEVNIGSIVVLYSLLSGYVQLFKREQEKGVQLERAIHYRDEFLVIASHELKTPITVLKLHAKAIQSEMSRNESTFFHSDRLENYSRELNKQVTRLARLVDEMMNVSQIQFGQLKFQVEEVELCSLVNAVVERLVPKLEEARVVVNLECSQPVIGVWDRHLIENVVENLLINAIQYGNGRPIKVQVESKDSTAKLQVTDHGRGIAKEDQKGIFNSIERNISRGEVRGLGVSLYISEQILQLHQGRIWVESELEKGSTFVFELPLYPAAYAMREIPMISKKLSKNGEA